MTLSEIFRHWLSEPILREINIMSATLDDLRDALTALDTKIDEDLAQTIEIINAVNSLIAKVGTSPDVSAEVAAVSALITKIASDNPAVKAAIDAAGAA